MSNMDESDAIEIFTDTEESTSYQMDGLSSSNSIESIRSLEASTEPVNVIVDRIPCVPSSGTMEETFVEERLDI